MAWHDSIWDEMNRMQKKIDRVFGKMGFSRWEKDYDEDYRRASAEFKETEEEFIIKIEMPGIEKEDISMHVTETGFEIRAEKKREEKKEDKNKGEYSYAKSYSGFYRSFNIPENADLERIDASYKNGLLTIKIPKKQTKDKKLIQIK